MTSFTHFEPLFAILPFVYVYLYWHFVHVRAGFWQEGICILFYVRAVLVFGSAGVADTGNYTCVADQATQTVLFIVTPGRIIIIYAECLCLSV